MAFTPIMTPLDNGRIVPVVQVAPTASLTGLAQALAIPTSRGAVALVGGAAAFDKPEYGLVRERVGILVNEIAQLAIAYQLAVVDGGTPFGVMKLMGGVAHRHQYRFPLVGVAPSGKVIWDVGPRSINYQATWYGKAVDPQKLKALSNRAPLDIHHSGFVLVEADEWGAEVELLAATAHELAGTYGSLEVLINGGEVARRDVTAYLRRGGRVIVVEGTGRFADELATALREGYSADPDVQAVLDSDRIHRFSIHEPPQLFTQMLMRLGGWTI